jgi:hypothetical protein
MLYDRTQALGVMNQASAYRDLVEDYAPLRVATP